MNDEQLVDAFGNVALQAGKSNSGMCISASATSDWEKMQTLRQALKDRLRELRQIAEKHNAEQ
jgi:ABC-type branched-subunit amino acid transport system substrate-binding protein